MKYHNNDYFQINFSMHLRAYTHTYYDSYININLLNSFININIKDLTNNIILYSINNRIIKYYLEKQDFLYYMFNNNLNKNTSS
jgi:hypothetical protein